MPKLIMGSLLGVLIVMKRIALWDLKGPHFGGCPRREYKITTLTMLRGLPEC